MEYYIGIILLILVYNIHTCTSCASSISKRPVRPARPASSIITTTSVPVVEPRPLQAETTTTTTTSTTTTQRSNVTFPTYKCPHPYSEYYCLNEAKCFTIIIQDSPLYNCECRDGFVGQRCEYKDLDGSYLLSRSRLLLETASIASGASLALLLVALIAATLWARTRRTGKRPPDPT